MTRILLNWAGLKKSLLKAFPDFEIKQMNYSCVLPGAVKADCVHKNQKISGLFYQVQVFSRLQDLREEFKTEGVKCVLCWGQASAIALIPRGVAHGLANLNSAPANMIYLLIGISRMKRIVMNIDCSFLGKIFGK